MSLLLDSQSQENGTESDTAASNDTQEYITAEETPFTLIRGTASRINHYILKDATSFHADIEHRGEAYDGDFEGACTIPPAGDLGRPHPSDKRYWTAVAPTLATSEQVEWIGSMGINLDATTDKTKIQLHESLHERFGDSFSSDVIDTATDAYITIRDNQQQHGRRVSLEELKAPYWASGVKYGTSMEQAYNRLLPRLDEIEEPSRKAEPDWLWLSD